MASLQIHSSKKATTKENRKKENFFETGSCTTLKVYRLYQSSHVVNVNIENNTHRRSIRLQRLVESNNEEIRHQDVVIFELRSVKHEGPVSLNTKLGA